jgi:hypothetical protein
MGDNNASNSAILSRILFNAITMINVISTNYMNNPSLIFDICKQCHVLTVLLLTKISSSNFFRLIALPLRLDEVFSSWLILGERGRGEHLPEVEA